MIVSNHLLQASYYVVFTSRQRKGTRPKKPGDAGKEGRAKLLRQRESCWLFSIIGGTWPELLMLPHCESFDTLRPNNAQTNSARIHLVRRLQGHGSHRCNVANPRLGKVNVSRSTVWCVSVRRYVSTLCSPCWSLSRCRKAHIDHDRCLTASIRISLVGSIFFLSSVRCRRLSMIEYLIGWIRSWMHT